MPHIVIEHSTNIVENVDFQQLFSRMHWILTELGSFKLDDIKSRVHPCSTYYIADGNANYAFVHIRLEILEGREIPFQKQAGERLMTLLKETFAQSLRDRRLKLSIEIRDMRRDTYFKFES